MGAVIIVIDLELRAAGAYSGSINVINNFE